MNELTDDDDTRDGKLVLANCCRCRTLLRGRHNAVKGYTGIPLVYRKFDGGRCICSDCAEVVVSTWPRTGGR